MVIVLSFLSLLIFLDSLSTVKTSVLKLQVRLSGKGRSLQMNLNRIVEVADSWSFLLTKAVVALLQRLDCCISSYSRVNVKGIKEDGVIHFNRLSIEERGKIDENTLINVNSTKKQSTMSQRDSGFDDEYIVVTILVVADEVHKLPIINGSEDLKEALETLGSIPPNKIYAIKIMWIPNKEDLTLTEKEYLNIITL